MLMSGYSDHIQQWAITNPYQIALWDVESDRKLRYIELSQRSWQLYHALKSLGVQKGDRIASIANNRTELFEIYVACLRLGAAWTPLNWRLAVPELRDILVHAKPKCLIYDGDFAQKAVDVLHHCHLNTEKDELFIQGIAWDQKESLNHLNYEDLLAQSSSQPPMPIEAHDPETLAMLLYTSGTTGKPKGVMIPHRQLFFNAINTVYACDLTPNDRVFACLPLFHTGGLNSLATPILYRGGMICLTKGFDAKQALKVMEEQQITAVVAVPTMYQMMLEQGIDRYRLPNLRTVLCGGAGISTALIDAYLTRGFIFRQGFGMTEVGPNDFSLPPQMVHQKKGSIGQVILHLEAQIIDDHGQILGPNQIGEMRFRGPGVCLGYWDDPVATQASLRDGWFYTGDLLQYDEEGYFYVAGRKKDMFISGGENVYPAEVEEIISRFPHVSMNAVIGIPDEKWGEVGLAVIAPMAGYTIDVEALKAFCVDHLAKFKVPKRFEVLAELPKNDSGKINKNLLRKQFLN
jgi:fatty-acyl-CoA synthase